MLTPARRRGRCEELFLSINSEVRAKIMSCCSHGESFVFVDNDDKYFAITSPVLPSSSSSQNAVKKSRAKVVTASLLILQIEFILEGGEIFFCLSLLGCRHVLSTYVDNGLNSPDEKSRRKISIEYLLGCVNSLVRKISDKSSIATNQVKIISKKLSRPFIDLAPVFCSMVNKVIFFPFCVQVFKAAHTTNEIDYFSS